MVSVLSGAEIFFFFHSGTGKKSLQEGSWRAGRRSLALPECEPQESKQLLLQTMTGEVVTSGEGRVSVQARR